MTENTPENRKLFYSQYYGQKVLFDRACKENVRLCEHTRNWLKKNDRQFQAIYGKNENP